MRTRQAYDKERPEGVSAQEEIMARLQNIESALRNIDFSMNIVAMCMYYELKKSGGSRYGEVARDVAKFFREVFARDEY